MPWTRSDVVFLVVCGLLVANAIRYHVRHARIA